MAQSHESEAPYGRLEPPFAQYMVALRPLQRVVWSVVGSGGFTSPKETAEVLQLARSGGNFAGVMLDDFFHDKKEGKRRQLTVDELAKIRHDLKQIGKHLDIYATLYVRQLELPLHDYLELIDVITLWSMDSVDVRKPGSEPEEGRSRCPQGPQDARLLRGRLRQEARDSAGADEASMRNRIASAAGATDRRHDFPGQYGDGPGVRVGRMDPRVDSEGGRHGIVARGEPEAFSNRALAAGGCSPAATARWFVVGLADGHLGWYSIVGSD